jgi:hypothetical protein
MGSSSDTQELLPTSPDDAADREAADDAGRRRCGLLPLPTSLPQPSLLEPLPLPVPLLPLLEPPPLPMPRLLVLPIPLLLLRPALPLRMPWLLTALFEVSSLRLVPLALLVGPLRSRRALRKPAPWGGSSSEPGSEPTSSEQPMLEVWSRLPPLWPPLPPLLLRLRPPLLVPRAEPRLPLAPLLLALLLRPAATEAAGVPEAWSEEAAALVEAAWLVAADDDATDEAEDDGEAGNAIEAPSRRAEGATSRGARV